MRYLIAAAAALLPLPAAAQSLPSVQIAAFRDQSGATLPRAREVYSVSVTQNDTDTDGYVMIFPTLTVPVDGPVTPIMCFYIGAGPSTTSLSMGPNPVSMSVGMSWAFSIADSCAVKQAAAVGFVSVAFR